MSNYNTFPAILKTDDFRSVWSKKVTKRRRRSAAKDQKALDIMRASAPPLVTGPDGALVTDTLPTNDNTKSVKKRAKFHAYEHTTDRAKATAANRSLYAQGRGYAFTLNLAPAEIAAANDNVKGFTDHFTRRISRALKRAGVYAPYWFSVHATAAGRLHIHGGLEANDNDVTAIKQALEHAGGEWETVRGRQYQCDLQRMYAPDVWANYCLTDQAKVRRLIRGPGISITNPLRRRARALWSVLRGRGSGS